VNSAGYPLGDFNPWLAARIPNYFNNIHQPVVFGAITELFLQLPLVRGLLKPATACRSRLLTLIDRLQRQVERHPECPREGIEEKR
jgi:hypothetical protein